MARSADPDDAGASSGREATGQGCPEKVQSRRDWVIVSRAAIPFGVRPWECAYLPCVDWALYADARNIPPIPQEGEGGVTERSEGKAGWGPGATSHKALRRVGPHPAARLRRAATLPRALRFAEEGGAPSIPSTVFIR